MKYLTYDFEITTIRCPLITSIENIYYIVNNNISTKLWSLDLKPKFLAYRKILWVRII